MKIEFPLFSGMLVFIYYWN